MSESLDPTRDRGGRGAGALLLTLAGFAAAFAVAACCALPLVLAGLGIGAASLAGLALLAAPHRPLLIAVAGVCFIGAALLLRRQQSAAACRPGEACSRPALRRLTLTGLAAGVALLCLGIAFA